MLITKELVVQLALKKSLCLWVDANGVTLETLEVWKQQSHALYATDPDYTLEIARCAERVADCISDAASAFAAWMMGNALIQKADFAAAVSKLKEAGSYYRRNDQPLIAAQLSIGLIYALPYIGDLQEAIQIGKELETFLQPVVAVDPEKLTLLAKVYNNLAIPHEFLHQFEEALNVQNKTLAIVTKGMTVGRVQHNRACVLDKLNLYGEAQDAFSIAEQQFLTAGAAADLARLYLNKGLLEAHWRRHEAAEHCFQQAAHYLKQEAQPHLEAYLRYYRCLNGFAVENYTIELLNELNLARSAFERLGPTTDLGMCWVTIGRYYIAHQQWQMAEIAIQKALSIADKYADIRLRWQAMYTLAKLFVLQNKSAHAIEAATAAITTIESLRTRLRVETFRAAFLTDKLQVYELLAHLYIQRGEYEQALTVMEKARARLLLERLHSRVAAETQTLETADSAVVRALAMRLRNTLTQLDQLQKRDLGEQQVSDVPQDVPQTMEMLTKLERQVSVQIREIQQHQPLFAPLSTGVMRSLNACAETLAAESCLLYYTIVQSDIHCFIIDRGGIVAHKRLASLASVQQIQQQLMVNIQRTLAVAAQAGALLLSRMMTTLLPVAQHCLTQLGEMLIAPLHAQLGDYAHWIVAPERDLYYVPFHALQLQDKYLIERQQISYIPSLNVLHLAHQPVQQQTDGIGVMGYGGEMLPAVAHEVAQLGYSLPSADIYHPATTDSFLEQAHRYRLIHLAAHAHFRTDNPMLSAFELADRPLTLAEIARLQLGAELVVLSACETGFGRMQGSDFISLAGGLMAAGARSLLVSQWRVDDQATLQLMDTFYRALQRGKSRVAALQSAQCQLLQLAQEQPTYAIYAHPAYWAPFTLLGNSHPLEMFSSLELR